jgi:Dolichyl-phosphate-mannose-protein mannosyltransferase
LTGSLGAIEMTPLLIPFTTARSYDFHALIPAAALPIWLTVLGPWWIVYEFHPNEGLNFIKGALVANGYTLYDQVWNDQPPGLTLILAAIHRIFPFSIGIPRAVIIAFSSLLLWALFRIVRRSSGTLAAWSAVAVLGLSTQFLLFGVSVMIGHPAVALAVCALDQAMISVTEKSRWRLVATGVLFGLSLQIKMFTALALPSLICAILLFSKASSEPLRWRDAAVAFAAILATFLLFLFAFHEPFLDQLFMPHWNAARSTAYEEEGQHGWLYFGSLLALEPVLLGLGILGIVAVLRRPRELDGTKLIPVIWLCLSVVVFATHKPVAPRHLIMTMVPLAWLGGIAVSKLAHWVENARMRLPYRRTFATIGLAALLVANAWTPLRFGTVTPPPSPIAVIMERLKIDATSEGWVVADESIDAYRAKVLVPPELAVFSLKRVKTGYLPAEMIINTISTYRPSVVRFSLLPVEPAVDHFLRESSYVALTAAGGQNYIRGDLVPSYPPPRARPSFTWPN